MEHEIIMTNRKKITVSNVKSVDTFDENEILINLQDEALMIYGTNLHLEGLDLEDGMFIAEGNIECVDYMKVKEKKSLRERFRR